MRDNEKENNQPEAEVEPPILGCLLGSLTAYLVSSSEIDTLPCASSSVKDTTHGWRKSTSREDATSTYETDKARENDTTL
ncbi:hypothetical protein ACFX1R_016205 [Malus domestica]